MIKAPAKIMYVKIFLERDMAPPLLFPLADQSMMKMAAAIPCIRAERAQKASTIAVVFIIS
jgi:hypothetical protein